MKKRKQMIQKEEERLRIARDRAARLKAIVRGDEREEIDPVDDQDDETDGVKSRSIVGEAGMYGEDNEQEEDEEMALAREIEEQKRLEADEMKQGDAEPTDTVVGSLGVDGGLRPQTSQETDEVLSETDKDGDFTLENSKINDDGNQTSESKNEGAILDTLGNTNIDVEKESENNKETIEPLELKGKFKPEKNEAQVKPENMEDDKEAEFDETKELTLSLGKGSNRSRNAGWKAMLEKEALLLKKQKARGRSNIVDAEAEEEEDEEGVQGLEDFGFSLQSKKKDGEDEDIVAEKEDFENIVDDLSDNEGDEEAGETARKELAQKEEKDRHKEIMRRMREGYDGRRGGIGSGNARGNHRFDQLVAADNRSDAKRLGLLNDDEFDSDDEGDVQENLEVEDETVLLDKMLKDRYLNRPQLPDEVFSDADEDSDDEEESGGKCISSFISY